MKKVLYAAALLFLVTACTPKPESKPYTWEDDLHQRLLTDFSRTEDEVKEYIVSISLMFPMSRCANGKPPKHWSV